MIQEMLKLMQEVSQEDFEQLEVEIQVKEAEIEELKQLRGILALKLGVEIQKPGRWGGPRVPGGKKPGPKKATAKTDSDDEESRRDTMPLEGEASQLQKAKKTNLILELLNKENRPLKGGEISRMLSIPLGSLASYLAGCAWFESTSQGYVLTVAGKTAARQLAG
jgi:hypothetical protein